jgi:hypothetical protein
VLVQVLGPAIAARVVREKVQKYGTVKSVKVKAWPALELAWRQADEVSVSAGRLKVNPQETVAMLKEAKGVAKMSVSAESVEEGSLKLTSTRFEKHGHMLRVEGIVSEDAIKRALPKGVGVALMKSEGGTIEVRVSGGLFGVNASVDAVAKAQEGKLVVQPLVFGLEGLRLTLFSNPSVYVEGVEARAKKGSGGEGVSYWLSMWASLR